MHGGSLTRMAQCTNIVNRKEGGKVSEIRNDVAQNYTEVKQTGVRRKVR